VRRVMRPLYIEMGIMPSEQPLPEETTA